MRIKWIPVCKSVIPVFVFDLVKMSHLILTIPVTCNIYVITCTHLFQSIPVVHCR
jgi:hypothetical protein